MIQAPGLICASKVGTYQSGAPFSSLFHKQIMCVTYNFSKISHTVHCMHAPMQYSQNTQAYIPMAVGYAHKMLMKLTT